MENRLKLCIDYLISQRRLFNSADLSRITGKTKSYISEVLAGKREMSEQFVRAVTNAFPEISTRWLLYGEGEMTEVKNIYDRINTVLARQSLSKRDFEKGTNTGNFLFPGVYNNAEKNPGDIKIAEGWIECLLHLFPWYSKEWLLYGKGEMEIEEKQFPNKIPLYDAQSIGGKNDLCAPTGDAAHVAEWIDAGDWFPQASAAIHHYGDSMTEYPSGCILVLKIVNDRSLIINGQTYVIETDEYRVTKIIHDEGDYLMAYSTNQETMSDGSLRHKPFQIPKASIRRLFLVIGCVLKEFANGPIPIIQ